MRERWRELLPWRRDWKARKKDRGKSKEEMN